MEPDTNIQPVIANPVPAPQTPAPSLLPSIPESWPGAFGLYKYSKQAVKINVWTVVVIWLLSAIVESVLDHALKQPGQIISFVINSLLTASLALTYIASVRGQRLTFSQAINGALPLWLKMVFLNILVVLSLIGSAVLLIVPFFFVYPRLTLANYFLLDKKLGVLDAYKASWAATKGYSVKMWGIFGASLLMALLMITIIGIPFAIYFLFMYSAAYAVAYEFLNTAHPIQAQQPVPVSPVQPSTPPVSPPTPQPTDPTPAVVPTAPVTPQPVSETPTEPTPPVSPTPPTTPESI